MDISIGSGQEPIPEGITRGDLRSLALGEISQLLSLGSRTARVILRSRHEQGVVWFNQGDIVHAECGDIRWGAPAFYEMLRWGDGEFVIEYGLRTDRRSLEGDVMQHVLEGIRRMEEERALEPRQDEPSSSQEIHPLESTHPSMAAPSPEPVATEVCSAPATLGRSARKQTWFVAPLALLLAAILWGVLGPSGRTERTQEAGVIAAQAASPAPVIASVEPQSRPANSAARRASKPVKKPVARVEPLPEPDPAPPPDEQPEAPALLAEFSLPEGEIVEADLVEVARQEPDAFLGLELRSKLEVGKLEILVDGQPAYAMDLRKTPRLFRKRGPDGDVPLDARIPLFAGDHRVAARVRLEDGSLAETGEESLTFTTGSSHRLVVSAGVRRDRPIMIEVAD